MARQRMLSPKFFTDGRVCSLPPLTRLLFQGLWCEADRAGRLPDEPIDLKIRLLPLDACDVNVMLSELAKVGLIERYTVAGRRLISIPNFLKHQQPHHKEPASTLPAPGEPGVSPTFPGASPTESESESESESVKSLRAKKPPAPPKPEKPTDPRHAPLVKALCEAIPEYTFDSGRDARQVTVLLAKGPPDEVVLRWRRAWTWPLKFPRVRTLTELVTMWPHFATDAPAAAKNAPTNPDQQFPLGAL